MKLNRRELVYTGIGALAGLLGSQLRGKPSYASSSNQENLNWKQPRKLDLPQAASLAYDGYKDRGMGCCHGVFKGNDGKFLREVGTNMSCPACHPGRKKNHPRSMDKAGKKKT